MKTATWKDLVLGALVASLLGAIAARVLSGPAEQQLIVEVNGASLPAENGGKVELAVAPARFQLQCRGACDELTLGFRGTPELAAWARITDARGRTVAARHDAENGKVLIGGGAVQARSAP